MRLKSLQNKIPAALTAGVFNFCKRQKIFSKHRFSCHKSLREFVLYIEGQSGSGLHLVLNKKQCVCIFGGI